MSEAVLRVDAAGPHATIQDGGRRGYMRYGVPWSGPLDRLSFAAANLALGNAADAPALEISLGGLSLACVSGSVSFATAGGGFSVESGGVRRGSWAVATLRAGETLTIRPGRWGSWSYLAFAGALAAPSWLGSAATHATSGFGGGALTIGRTLTIAAAETRTEREGAIPFPIAARPRRALRVTLGPQERFFDAETTRRFLAGPWRLTDAWDRMGVRLAGSSAPPDAPLDMPSEAIVRGSVQVAGDGAPVILLADHQTTGGYPKIATVLECDVDGLVQLRPREAVQFAPVSAAEAVAIARTAALGARTYYRALAKRRR